MNPPPNRHSGDAFTRYERAVGKVILIFLGTFFGITGVIHLLGVGIAEAIAIAILVSTGVGVVLERRLSEHFSDPSPHP